MNKNTFNRKKINIYVFIYIFIEEKRNKYNKNVKKCLQMKKNEI